MWLTKPPSPDDGRSSTSPKSRLPGMRGHRQIPGVRSDHHHHQQQHQSRQSFTMHNNKRSSNQKPNVIISSYGVAVAPLFLLLLLFITLSEGASPESGGPSLEAVLSKGPKTHMTPTEYSTSEKHSPLLMRYAQLSQPSRVSCADLSLSRSKIQQERE